MTLKERDLMYRLIISQLLYDGHQSAALSLIPVLNISASCGPSDRLLKLVQVGLTYSDDDPERTNIKEEMIIPNTGMDLDVEFESSTMAPEASFYETCYVTAHKAACRSAAFNSLGQLVATGSEDSSIKILDVERMLAKSGGPIDHTGQESTQQQMETHPVIRTLYDHQAEVSCLDFHPDPNLQILVSGSKDYTVKFFDFSNPSVKKAFKSLPESSPVRTVKFHRTGDYLLVGTQHQTLRIYDVNTSRCFVSQVPEDQHEGPINMVDWSPNSSIFASCSNDGSFKIWDGVSCRCIQTFEKAHDNFAVCSVQFSKNNKYLLTSGKDSVVKLWELSTGRCLIEYLGAGTTGRQMHRTAAVFNHTEDYVMYPDEDTKSLCCWDSRKADRQRLLSLNHNGAVRCFVHSPTSPAFLSCSDDNRARFWYKRPISD